MNKYLQKVKDHIRENKKQYIAGGVGLGVGGLAVLAYVSQSSSGSDLLAKINQVAVGWKPVNKFNIFNFIERSTPSKPVRLVNTDEYFNSLSEAARETGHSLPSISNNVHGKTPHIKGDVFELVSGVA